MTEIYYYTWNGLKYYYRYDPVPYTGKYCSRKERPPYNIRRTFIRYSIQDEEFRHFKDPKYKEMVSIYGGGCRHCYRYFSSWKRHTDRCWKSSCKFRKQWMKHRKKHFPTVTERRLDDYDEEVYYRKTMGENLQAEN